MAQKTGRGGLNAQQQRFVAEYLVDLNGRQAAIRAGYSAKTAEVQASKLLSLPKIAGAIAVATSKHLEAVGLTVESIVEAIRRQIQGDIRKLFDADGNYIPIHKLTAEDAALLSSYEVILKNAEAGDGKIDRVLKVRVKEQAKYVELGMKYLGMLKDVVEVTGDWDKLAARLVSARQR